MKLIFPVVCILFLHVAQSEAADLMLAGGHLPVCTSLSPQQCTTPAEWNADALTETRFFVDQQGIERWKSAAATRLESRQIDITVSLLQQFQGVVESPVVAADFLRLFREQSLVVGKRRVTGEDALGEMSNRTWVMLRDHFQQPPISADGTVRREQVRLNDSVNEHSIAIFRRFVEIARQKNGGTRPLVAVTTASSRDPYDALAFYLQVFEQAGADTVWLPLDAAVRKARSEEDCDNLTRHQANILGSHHRDRIDPEKYARQIEFCKDPQAGIRLLEQADGVFLNGGDQWLTFQALLDDDGSDTPEMAAIRDKIAAGRMILGGTSAGSAVQSSRVMVTNGGLNNSLLRGAFQQSPPPDPGCDIDSSCPDGLQSADLTWHEHGIGTFPEGIVDTHFSERQRQFRLIRLLADTDASFAIGVDETTAALVEFSTDIASQTLEVIGAGSAWVIDITQASINRIPEFTVTNALLGQIEAGDTLIFDPSSFSRDWNSAPEGYRAKCIDFDPDGSFHSLVEELADHPAGRCFQFTLGQAGTASGQIRRKSASDGQPAPVAVFAMDLAVTPNSVVPPAAPDREQQPDPAKGGADESKQAE